MNTQRNKFFYWENLTLDQICDIVRNYHCDFYFGSDDWIELAKHVGSITDNLTNEEQEMVKTAFKYSADNLMKCDHNYDEPCPNNFKNINELQWKLPKLFCEKNFHQTNQCDCPFE